MSKPTEGGPTDPHVMESARLLWESRHPGQPLPDSLLPGLLREVHQNAEAIEDDLRGYVVRRLLARSGGWNRHWSLVARWLLALIAVAAILIAAIEFTSG